MHRDQKTHRQKQLLPAVKRSQSFRPTRPQQALPQLQRLLQRYRPLLREGLPRLDQQPPRAAAHLLGALQREAGAARGEPIPVARLRAEARAQPVGVGYCDQPGPRDGGHLHEEDSRDSNDGRLCLAACEREGTGERADQPATCQVLLWQHSQH